MTDELEKRVSAEGRPAYEAPRALRLGGPGAAGQQACQVPGSGNVNWCSVGNGATGDGCGDSGNAAESACTLYGISAAAGCLTGDSPVGGCDLGNGVLI